MLRTERWMSAPELGASHRAVEVRAPGFRVSRHEGVHVATDWALVERASPFVGALSGKTSVSIVLEGHGRFEEAGRRDWLSVGSVVASNQTRLGTEAYAGERASVIVIEWTDEYGAPFAGAFDHQRLGARDLERVRVSVDALDGPDPIGGVLALVRVLHANGLAVAPIARGDLEGTTTEAEQKLAIAVDQHLSRLESFPNVEDIADRLGWTPRHVTRRYAELAKSLCMTATSWRSMLHHMRLVTAFRILSAPGATTELVARKTGFRSPNALCHAFANAGLPSPGVIARAAQRDVLDAWTAFSDERIEVA